MEVIVDNNIRPRFGNRDLGAFKKRAARARKLDEVTVAVVHQTACVFGTSKYQRAPWDRIARDFNLDASFSRTWARRARFWNVPYHYVITYDGFALWNQPLVWRTWHGDAGNGGIGIAFEGRWPGVGELDPKRHTQLCFNPEGALWACIDHARKHGAPIDQIQAHRNYAPPSSRASDPGETVWRNAVVPLLRAPELGLRCDYEGAAGGGRPIPREWDDHALYDWHGKRIEGGAA